MTSNATLEIRPEAAADRAAVRAAIEAAFGRPDEAELVEALRRDGDAAIARAAGWRAEFLVGEPAYYARFGFDAGRAALTHS